VISTVVGGRHRRDRARSADRRGGSGWLTIVSVSAGAGNYVFAVLLTHRLPAAQYSVFAASQSILLLNGLIGSAGIPWVVAREISQADGDSVRQRLAITFGFWGNVVTGAALGLFGACIGSFFASWQVVLEVFLTTWILAVGATGPAVLQGQRRTGAIAKIIAVEVVLKLAVGLAFVEMWHSAVAALAGSLVGVLALYGGYGEVIGRVGRPSLSAADRELWRSALHLGKLQIGVGIFSAVDNVAVAILPVGHVAAATYQAAAALGRIPAFISNAVSTAAYPVLVRPAQALAARTEAMISYTVLGGFIVVVLVTVPRSVVLLFFPHTFAGLVSFLPYTATLGVGVGALNLLATFAQSRDRTYPTGWTLLGAVIVVLVAVVIGQRLGDVRGLSLAADVVCWVAVTLIASERYERGAVRSLCSRRFVPRLLPVGVSAVVLSVAQTRLTWISMAALLGLVALVAAFAGHARGHLNRAPEVP
jgi:O-antigen/teichoic acid export membrane protein